MKITKKKLTKKRVIKRKKLNKKEIHDIYLQDIALVKKYKDDKDTLLKEMIDLHYNLPQIVIAAKSSSLYGKEIYNDLYQSGLEGMCKAMKTFDTSKGVPFFFHARFWVFKEVTDQLYRMNMILDRSGGVRAYSVDDIESHLEEINESANSVNITDEDNERNIEFTNTVIRDYIEDNKEEIKIISMYNDGFSMSAISTNEKISSNRVRYTIRGRFDKNKNQIKKPFIEVFEEEILDMSGCKTFKEFKEKYISYK